MHRRPLVNTRDEPHADPAQYRRLHLIIGDANMCEYTTALKVGTASLVLDLLEAGALPSFTLADPIGTLKAISRDESQQWPVALAEGKVSSALEIQTAFMTAATRIFRAATRRPIGCLQLGETCWIPSHAIRKSWWDASIG